MVAKLLSHAAGVHLVLHQMWFRWTQQQYEYCTPEQLDYAVRERARATPSTQCRTPSTLWSSPSTMSSAPPSS